MSGAVSGVSAAVTLAGLTLRRMLRGRLLWFSVSAAVLPLVIVSLVTIEETPLNAWSAVFQVLIFLIAIIPALHLSSVIGEEIEDNTFTYLWSRPFPRWSLLLGKLLALIPVAVILVCSAIVAAFAISVGDHASALAGVMGDSVVAALLGTIAASCLCVGFGAIVPKQATSVSLVYLLVLDPGIKAIPFSIQNITIRYHVEHIALAVDKDMTTSILWLIGMSVFWLAIALWRVTSVEFSTYK